MKTRPLALLAVLPFALQIAVENLMDALEHEPPWLVREGDDPLAAQNVGSFALNEIVKPGNEAIGIDRAVVADRDGMHLVVVEMLQPGVGRALMRMLALVRMATTVVVMIVIVMTVIVMIMAAIWTAFMMMVVIVISTSRLEEGRLDGEYPVEVEGVAVLEPPQGNVRPTAAINVA